MTKQELIDYCLNFPCAFLDYPFDETTAVIKHIGNKKMFACIDDVRLGRPYISLKCDPMKADFLCGAFKSVEPAWHFNKQHWNGVDVNGDVPTEELYDMIQHSFDLTKPKVKRQRGIKNDQ